MVMFTTKSTSYFLYREDFEKFEDGFIDATDKIKELMATGNYRDPIAERASEEGDSSNSDSDNGGELLTQKQHLRSLQRTKLNSTTYKTLFTSFKLIKVLNGLIL